MISHIVHIDFEYNQTNLAKLNLIAASYEVFTVKKELIITKVIWLSDNETNKDELKHFISQMKDKSLFVSYNVDAEARSFISLGFNPSEFKWFDLQAEFKMLQNHCNEYRYGNQYIGGKEVTTFPPKFGVEDKLNHSRPDTSLAACLYKMLGIKIDLDYKKGMVKKILRGNFTKHSMQEILDYCENDTGDMQDLFIAICRAMKKLYGRKFEITKYIEEAQYRGDTVSRGAIICSKGYPVDPEAVGNFIHNVPYILKECQEDIMRQFPKLSLFRWDKKNNRYSISELILKTWIKSKEFPNWPKTKNNAPSLALDAFEKYFHYRHSFPQKNLGAQMVRLKRLKQALNGFLPKAINAKDKTTFKSFYDGERAHPYLNAYGAQSGRYQPKATGFIHLKSAWIRSLVQPKKGMAIASLDYGSQEFLIAALMSKDTKMINAYKSGDVYLAFAILAGVAPKGATRKTHELERGRCKSTVLAVSYLMGPAALANKLEQDTGREHTQEEAQDLINLFNETFDKYDDWRNNIINLYDFKEIPYLKLADGWTMWGDNPNPRSVGNMPIQGKGGEILRRAIKYCQNSGLDVIIPLHDALYIEFKAEEYKTIIPIFKKCMVDAFTDSFPKQREQASIIRTDVCLWGSSFEDGECLIEGTKVKTQRFYIDERSEKDYKTFSKYFISKFSGEETWEESN